MPKTRTLQVVIDDVLREAMQQHCIARGVRQSEVIRRGIAAEIGRPDLGESIKLGKPPRADDPESGE